MNTVFGNTLQNLNNNSANKSGKHSTAGFYQTAYKIASFT